MPLSHTHSPEIRPQPVVRQLATPEEDSLNKFLYQELRHWLSDLNQRNIEGQYYLEWFSWLEPDAAATDNVRTFERLIKQDIPALDRMIREFLEQQEESDTDGLLSAQRNYRQFCERFDRIKRLLLADVEIRNNFRIY